MSQKSLHRNYLMILSAIEQGLPIAKGLKAVLYSIYHVVNRISVSEHFL